MIRADRELERWVVTHRVGWLNPVFEALTAIGAQGLVWLALALVLAALWRRPSLFVTVLAADLLANLLASALKLAIGRRRPPVLDPHPRPLVHTPHDGSFPSGHAATAFACASLLAVAVPRFAAPLVLLAAAIAWSRVYVGVHYPLDVLGGALLGVLVATALLSLSAIRRRSRRGRPAG